jgi:phosphoribosylformimino-5-aminoimidazole carboxamide ribotide isomerase
MRFRPCIDLHEGKVKQIVGSTLRDRVGNGRRAVPDDGLVTNFETDRSAADYARLYRDDDLPGGHVIMLGPGNEAAAREALRAYPGGLQVGGGIGPDNAAQYLDAGASHVIVTSYVFREGRIDYGNLNQLVAAVGKERLVLDLSCRKRGAEYVVVTDRWQNFTEVALTPENLDYLARFCVEFLVHGVDVEGQREGLQEDLVQALGAWSPIPATYAGGARSLEDLERVRQLGQGRIDLTIGSALDIFGGHLPYRAMVEWQRRQEGR